MRSLIFFVYFCCCKERQVLREKLSDLLGEKVRQIIEIMDKPDYTPKVQNQSQLDTIYESEFRDIQPYLFRVKYFNFFLNTSSKEVVLVTENLINFSLLYNTALLILHNFT